MAASDLSHEDLRKRIRQLMAERIDDSYYSQGAGVQLLDRIIPKRGGARPQNRNINRSGIMSGGACKGGAGNGIANHSAGGAKKACKPCKPCKPCPKKKKYKCSNWIAHVKRYQKQHGVSYKEALKRAGASYRK
jgi:hypothetical protein